MVRPRRAGPHDRLQHRSHRPGRRADDVRGAGQRGVRGPHLPAQRQQRLPAVARRQHDRGRRRGGHRRRAARLGRQRRGVRQRRRPARRDGGGCVRDRRRQPLLPRPPARGGSGRADRAVVGRAGRPRRAHQHLRRRRHPLRRRRRARPAVPRVAGDRRSGHPRRRQPRVPREPGRGSGAADPRHVRNRLRPRRSCAPTSSARSTVRRCGRWTRRTSADVLVGVSTRRWRRSPARHDRGAARAPLRPARVGAGAGRRRASWSIAPIAMLATSILRPNTDVWRQQWETRLPDQIITTIVLTVGVVVGSVVLGVGWRGSSARTASPAGGCSAGPSCCRSPCRATSSAS